MGAPANIPLFRKEKSQEARHSSESLIRNSFNIDKALKALNFLWFRLQEAPVIQVIHGPNLNDSTRVAADNAIAMELTQSKLGLCVFPKIGELRKKLRDYFGEGCRSTRRVDGDMAKQAVQAYASATRLVLDVMDVKFVNGRVKWKAAQHSS